MQLSIPESIIQSMGAASKPSYSKNWPLPFKGKAEGRNVSLAIQEFQESRLPWSNYTLLYSHGLSSLGQAYELANLDHWQFSQLAGDSRRPVFDHRTIPRHYSETALAEVLASGTAKHQESEYA